MDSSPRKLIEPSLYFFAAVAKAGSLSRASEQIGLTVPALSRHISRLESEIGVALFERHARGMDLSEAGRLLYRHAQHALLDTEAVLQEIRGGELRRERKITIACTEGFAFEFLPMALSAFSVAHPDAQVQIDVMSSASASQCLLDGRASIALAFTLGPEPGIAAHRTVPAPVLALMHGDHPLASRARLHLADLQHYPVVLQDEGTTIRQLLDIACDAEGVVLSSPLSSRYVAALYRFVQTTPGAVMLSGYLSVAGRLAQDGLVAVPFADPPVLQQRRLQIKTLAGSPLGGLANDCLHWLIDALDRIVGDDGIYRSPRRTNASRKAMR